MKVLPVKRVIDMSDYVIDMQNQKNEELDFTYRELQALDKYFEKKVKQSGLRSWFKRVK